ncbi:hypothetical protein CRENBAI_000698 [Crenichthys baileyi]|uniref:Uncharacterized protein n=1 Tax=Crenichthys baileyi TaxID=28760 RepID=A0AAV9S9I8_9TELE
MSTAAAVAAVFPMPLSATVLSPRLAATLPMPPALPPAQVSVETPDKLEERLRFFALQIKSVRRTSLLHPSPELKRRVKEMEENYRTAVRQFYCRPPSFTSGRQSGAAEQPTPGLQSAAAVKPTSGLQSAAVVRPKSGLQSTAAVQPMSGPAQATEGLDDASTPAQATEGLDDASAPAQATEGLDDAPAPVSALGRLNALASQGQPDASGRVEDVKTPTLGPKAFQGFKERLVLVLRFKEELLPDPVTERFEEKLVLILVPEPSDEGFKDELLPDPVPGLASEGPLGSIPSSESPLGPFPPSKGPLGSIPPSKGSAGSALASEGPVGSASSSEGPVGSAPASEGPIGSAPASGGPVGSAFASAGSLGSASASERSPDVVSVKIKDD